MAVSAQARDVIRGQFRSTLEVEVAGRIGRWWNGLPRMAQRALWLVFGWIWLASMLGTIQLSSRAPGDMVIRGAFLLVLLSPMVALGLSRRGRP